MRKVEVRKGDAARSGRPASGRASEVERKERRESMGDSGGNLKLFSLTEPKGGIAFAYAGFPMSVVCNGAHMVN